MGLTLSDETEPLLSKGVGVLTVKWGGNHKLLRSGDWQRAGLRTY